MRALLLSHSIQDFASNLAEKSKYLPEDEVEQLAPRSWIMLIYPINYANLPLNLSTPDSHDPHRNSKPHPM